MTNILIACEESGIVRRAFRGRGHAAWSNDVIPAADDGLHLQMDCFDAIVRREQWDLIILHPPCCALALSGNRWYGNGMPRNEERQEAIEWTLKLWDLARDHSRHVAMENPKSVIFPLLDKHDVQYLQPHHFGHPEFKETGFALHNLPRLRHVGQLRPPLPNTEQHREWQKVWRMGPSPDRKKLRSRTYLMIADAMADQWGSYIERNQ